MLKKIIVSLGVLLLFFPSVALEYKAPPPLPKPTINDLITLYAHRYDISEKSLHIVIKCESNYKPNAIGDGGNSFGLVQIHLPSHPHITKAQALDSEYAINFLAKSIKKGEGHIWTCYRDMLM